METTQYSVSDHKTWKRLQKYSFILKSRLLPKDATDKPIGDLSCICVTPIVIELESKWNILFH